ncbi:MAG: RNA pyrophosphohydrolase [Alphaproteobacteria bacterium]
MRVESSERGSGECWRRGVGAILFNSEKRVLMGRRADSPVNPSTNSSGEAWQFPQGGIDNGETPREALKRELMEEVGTCNIRIVAEFEEWLRYRLPEELRHALWGGGYAGQEQKWYLAHFLGTDAEIDINHHEVPEFMDWGWFPLEEAEQKIVPFKRELYRKLAEKFSPVLSSL